MNALLPGWVAAAICFAIAAAVTSWATDRRLLGRLPTRKLDRLEDEAFADRNERERMAHSVGWAAVHDACGQSVMRRSLRRAAMHDSHLAGLVMEVQVALQLARPAFANHSAAVQDSAWQPRPAVHPATATLVTYALAFPADVSLAATALTQRNRDLSVVDATPLALRVVGHALHERAVADPLAARPIAAAT